MTVCNFRLPYYFRIEAIQAITGILSYFIYDSVSELGWTACLTLYVDASSAKRD